MTSQSKKLLGQTDARQNLLNIVELFDGKPVIISVVIYSLIELNFTVLPQMFSALHVFYFIIGMVLHVLHVLHTLFIYLVPQIYFFGIMASSKK
mgnify:CR=1 FL=1